MSFSIWGLGTAVPDWHATQDRAAAVINEVSGFDEKQSLWVESLHRKTGVEHRHLVMLEHIDEILAPGPGRHPGFSTRWRMERYAEQAAPLASQAAGRALERAGLEAAEITHLVTVSCTGFAAPGVDLGLFESLGLNPGAQRTHVGFMGCHGALNGLRVARAFAASDHSARVLVCAVELPSLHFQYGPDPRATVVNALFADGAAAVVGRADRKNEGEDWRLVASGSTLVPDTADAMTWRIGDHGFEMTLSPRVPATIAEHLRPWLNGWLAAQGLTVAEIGSWAIHPGGPRVLDATERALGLGPEATADSRAVLAGFGNMSSPTILFILDRLRQRHAPRPCLALGFGPGLVIEAALFA